MIKIKRCRSSLTMLFFATLAGYGASGLQALPIQTPGDPQSGSRQASQGSDSKSNVAEQETLCGRVSVDVARDRAKLSHQILHATLHAMHRHYFSEDRDIVPAHAMKDIFRQMARSQEVKARWIAVNAQAMNIDHRPMDDFERQAARQIRSGKTVYERIENGTYRRAEAISLMNHGCLRCHAGLGASGKIKRFAGLVISIPVSDQASESR